ncbi:hypothetical protein LQE92_02440 [Lacrimispora sp. NSJ-141]|uniref:Uncharacterized protein n=1 Tax=Lientehia hominis TaxID=2897778 RepID=A0AAP2W7Z1_9FIRM|nr:hypothetical protein [Lientehia hominis]MCD2491486.1 hypothetical protein [Lientehia hominis]
MKKKFIAAMKYVSPAIIIIVLVPRFFGMNLPGWLNLSLLFAGMVLCIIAILLEKKENKNTNT